MIPVTLHVVILSFVIDNSSIMHIIGQNDGNMHDFRLSSAHLFCGDGGIIGQNSILPFFLTVF
jgi:hypothetical protein